MHQHRHQALKLVVTAIVVVAVAACGSSGSGNNNNGNGAGPVSGHSTTITGVGSAATGGGGGGGYMYSTSPRVHAQSASEPYFFTPTPDTVAVGSTMNFVFQDVGHTVTWDTNPGSLANISSLAAGGVINADSTRVVAMAGTYTWHCSIHTYMHGTLVVQ